MSLPDPGQRAARPSSPGHSTCSIGSAPTCLGQADSVVPSPQGGSVPGLTAKAQVDARLGATLQLCGARYLPFPSSAAGFGSHTTPETAPHDASPTATSDTYAQPNESGTLRTLGDNTWQDRAMCRSSDRHPVDPDLFFPKSDELDRIRAAKALCFQCSVRNVCIEAALENGDREGIRGGLTEEEREPLHRNFQHRLDYARVSAVLSGRDVYLTNVERQAVARAAYYVGMPAKRLAWLLKITEDHAEKVYRRIRREFRHRASG